VKILQRTRKPSRCWFISTSCTSSPSVCGYALRRTALDKSEIFSLETINANLIDFYVDDLLKSLKTIGDVVQITKELQVVLAIGGFQMTKVMFNEREVLDAFPPENHAPAAKILDNNNIKLKTYIAHA